MSVVLTLFMFTVVVASHITSSDFFTVTKKERLLLRFRVGAVRKDAARGVKIRCDWGPQYIADAWITEVKWLGITITPSYVGEPECNGVIERFIRTLKEQCLYSIGSKPWRRRAGSSRSSSRATTRSG